MIQLLTVIGARPQFIKAAALSRAIQRGYAGQVREILVHTGQHYDANMSQVFFDEMSIPKPDHMLEVGSGSHGKMTAAMIEKLEAVMQAEKPDCVVLYGDTNSTLAGAVAASKLLIPVAHIEAGLRSFNKAMPEEVNRILCDHVSSFLFCPTDTAVTNLSREGFRLDNPGPYHADNPKVYRCGDVMYDNTLFFAAWAQEKVRLIQDMGLEPGNFILATLHRNANTDDPQRLSSIFRALLGLVQDYSMPLVLPLHPRTRKLLETSLPESLRTALAQETRFRIIDPVGFLEMTALEANCRIVTTDSGGVQKESYFLRKPCVVLRPETEWVELLEQGTALLADADEARIRSAFDTLLHKTDLQFPPLFGDGDAAGFIVQELHTQLRR